MGKGERIDCPREVFRDVNTRHEVWKMTDWDGNQAAPYMYAQGFSRGERFLVFRSDIHGDWTLFALDIENEEAIQLTENGRAGGSFNITPEGSEVFYIGARGRQLRAVDIFTQEERTVAAVSDRRWSRLGGTPDFSRDGSRVVCAFYRHDEGSGIALAETGGSKFEEVFSHGEGIQHVQFAPTEKPMLSFAVSPDRQNNPDLPCRLRARAWTVDYRSREASPFLVTPPGFRATHEYWGGQEERLYYHKKTVPGWTPTGICSMKADGTDHREHINSDTRRLGHSAVDPEGKYIVTDVQKPDENELILIDLTTGKNRVLCWPNATVKSQLGHVHPSFSRKGDKVLYTSDVSGTAQVYVVPL